MAGPHPGPPQAPLRGQSRGIRRGGTGRRYSPRLHQPASIPAAREDRARDSSKTFSLTRRCAGVKPSSGWRGTVPAAGTAPGGARRETKPEINQEAVRISSVFLSPGRKSSWLALGKTGVGYARPLAATGDAGGYVGGLGASLVFSLTGRADWGWGKTGVLPHVCWPRGGLSQDASNVWGGPSKDQHQGCSKSHPPPPRALQAWEGSTLPQGTWKQRQTIPTTTQGIP